MDPWIFHLKLASAAYISRTPFPTHDLFDAFHTPEGILGASADDLAAIAGLHPIARQALMTVGDQDTLLRQHAILKKTGTRSLPFNDPEYPDPLRQIPDPPPVLFIRGELLPRDRFAIAVVGSRKATPYGISSCENLVQELIDSRFCVVSGMARGIDTIAHWTAIEGGGRTIGVLGAGLDVLYPKANAALFSKLPQQGALVTEFLPGTPPLPRHFPQRNRIISGMAQGVLVVEAAEKSGTMITVRMALEQGREVFAVPGDVRSSLSRGTHRLIKEGAKLVEGIEDIINELPLYGRPIKKQVANRPGSADVHPPSAPAKPGPGTDHLLGLKEEAKTVMTLLNADGVYVDTLMQRTGWPLEKMTVLLTELELVGKVIRLPGNRYLPGK